MINQSILNTLVPDLILLKTKLELLGLRLKQWNLLENDTKFSSFDFVMKSFHLSSILKMTRAIAKMFLA